MHSSISVHSFLSSSLRRKRSESELDGGGGSRSNSSSVISGRRVSYTSLVGGSSEYPYANHYHHPHSHLRSSSTTVASSESDHDDFKEEDRQFGILPTAIGGRTLSLSPSGKSQLRSGRSRTRALSSSSASQSYANPNGSSKGTDIANGNIRNDIPSSYSDYQLFTGRKPRPLSLPPSVSSLLGNGHSRASPAQHMFANASPVGSRSLSLSTGNNVSSGGGVSRGNIPDGHITSTTKLPSSYTQKFPVSYSTPEPLISSRKKMSGSNSSSCINAYSSGNRCVKNTCRSVSKSSDGGVGSKTVTNSSFCSSSEQNLSSETFSPPPSLYQSTKCQSYSFHGHPVNGNNCNDLGSYSPSGGSRSISDDTSPGSESLKIQNKNSINATNSSINHENNGKSSNAENNGNFDIGQGTFSKESSSKIKDNDDSSNKVDNNLSGDTSTSNQLHTLNKEASSSSKESISSIKVVFNKSSFRRSGAMSSSKSFTHASFFAEETCLSNTLPRIGKNKGVHRSSEQLALFLDILSSQEKFVKVGFSLE